MRASRPLLLLLSVALALHALPGQRATLEHVEYDQKAYESEALGKRVPYGVFLPIDYDAAENADADYPLVVWLHGMWEDHDRFRTRGGGEVLDRLVGSGEFPEAIFVCADGGRSSFWIDAEGADKAYETMVVTDLLAHLQATYRIRDGRDARAIAGVSMGGYGALKIALRHPDAFGAVAAHSAALLPADLDQLGEAVPRLRGRGQQLIGTIFGSPVDRDKWRAENVFALAQEVDAEALAGLKIYFDCGAADDWGFHAANQHLHQLLEKRDVKHTWRSVEGGDHGWSYTAGALPHALRFLAAQWSTRAATKGLEGMFGPAGAGKHESGRPRPATAGVGKQGGKGPDRAP